MEADLMCYQSSSQDCFQFAYIFKFLATKTSLQYRKTDCHRSVTRYPDLIKKTYEFSHSTDFDAI